MEANELKTNLKPKDNLSLQTKRSASMMALLKPGGSHFNV